MRVERIWSGLWGVLPVLAAAAIGAAGLARAVEIGDVDLLTFPSGGANTGLTNAGPGFDWAISPANEFLCAGDGIFVATGDACAGKTAFDLTVTQALQTVHQFPQGRGADNSPTDPFIADSLWTVTNTTDETLAGPLLLLFTNVNLTDLPASLVVGSAPDLDVGLDGNLVDITLFTSASGAFFYGSEELGTLGPGESSQFIMRYVVLSGPMPIVNNNVVIPSIAVLGAIVPEPGTLALVGMGVAVLGACGRRASGRRLGRAR